MARRSDRRESGVGGPLTHSCYTTTWDTAPFFDVRWVGRGEPLEPFQMLSTENAVNRFDGVQIVMMLRHAAMPAVEHDFERMRLSIKFRHEQTVVAHLLA